MATTLRRHARTSTLPVTTDISDTSRSDAGAERARRMARTSSLPGSVSMMTRRLGGMIVLEL